MVSHLRNIDDDLARTVAAGLWIAKLPPAAEAALPTNTDLEPSPALSILENGPESFAGRKLGIVVADGTSAADVTALVEAVTAAKATAEVIAPAVGGAKADDGSMLVANGQLAGNPSVVFDAVAIVVNEAGAKVLAEIPAARDFVADAFAHCKFIGYSPEARPLLERALGGFTPDRGTIALGEDADAERFVEVLGHLRLWSREKPNDTTSATPPRSRGRGGSGSRSASSRE